MTTVKWAKGQKSWYPFKNVSLSNVTAHGVYVIGYDDGDSGIATIYVGKGDIAARLQQHRSNNTILQYAEEGTLRVTWASVPAKQRDGVEKFLADKLEPVEGDRHPNDDPVEVNLPGGWF